MDPTEIRRTAIIAMFSDDMLMDRLVLKGGNALEIVHGLSARGSLDLDFSMEGDFDNLDEVRDKIFYVLKDRFDAVGMIVFDEKFMQKPKVRREGLDERWGGYRVEFKLIPKDSPASKLDIEHMRRNADVVGFAQEKVFCIDISRYEYCDPKVQAELDAFTIYVYPPQMIAAEKLRAICQQMPEYPLGNKSARARDFYDIHTIVTKSGLDMGLQEFRELLSAVFSAKDVALALLGRIKEQGAFHEPDWPRVELAVDEPIQPFAFYFDFVINEVEKLKPLWEE